MGLMLYNSLTNKMEEFKPIRDKKVNMYVCGPTVYNYIHIGNARPVIFYDMFKNYLTFLGYDVTYASNITDIDDKIIKKAMEEHKTEHEIASFYEKAFFEAVHMVGSHRPDLVPHATEYIEDMIDFIQELIEKGYAYEVDGDVYFRVSKVEDYGCLSNQVSEDLNQGARISVNDNKENPLDFTLWKKTNEGIKWDSPFGMGRPGWHTECVVMNHKLFKDEIDIHGGGMDLKFPHHENEIAQCQALYHHHLAKYWLHVGRLDMQGTKMSKSLGNCLYVKDLKTAKDGMILRSLILFSPYRSIISYSEELWQQYEREFDKWQRAYKQALYQIQYKGLKEDAICNEYMNSFIEFMNQDFNVQNVLSLINKIVKDMNQLVRSHDDENLVIAMNSLKKIFDVLGINLFIQPMKDEELEIYKKWISARENKDYINADKYRNMLMEWNII